VATHTCGSDMRHDGAPPSAIFAAETATEHRKKKPQNLTTQKKNRREKKREKTVHGPGVSTSRSMAASQDGTRLYADDLSFHRIGADRRKRQRNATQRKQQEEEVSLGIWESGRRDRSGGKCLDTRLGDVLIAVVAWRG
jgi:hypothetical protein